MNDVVILLLFSVVGFSGFVWLLSVIIGNYMYCLKRREREKQEALEKLPKNLKM